MSKRILGISIIALIVAIAIFHYVATIYHIYWIFVWTDVFVHFAGGLWIALASYWIFRFWRVHTGELSRTYLWLIMVGSAFLVGVLWELFEYHFGIIQYSASYPLDTFLDITMDVLGAGVGFFLLNLKKLAYIHNVS